MTTDTIISIGGSLISLQTGINTPYLKELNKIVRKKIASGKRFFIFTGGGHITKEYQYTSERVAGNVKDEDLNWLGIHTSRLNAHLLRTIFYDIALPNVLVNYDKKPVLGSAKVIICAAWLPGASTDFDMVNLAKVMNIKTAYSLLNVGGIYDRDPKLFRDARLIEKMRWIDYREMVGDWWNPKREVPFDPFASKIAQDFGMSVYFIDGKNLNNLQSLLEGKKFKGTLIE